MIKTSGGVFTKIIAVILVISILLSLFAGCGNTEPEESSSIDYGNVTVSEIVTEGVPVSEASTTSAFGEVTTSVPDIDPATNEETDEEWKKYIGDFETFTYGLLVNQLENEYNVFPAYTQLSTGDFVSGLAYTDYNECYTNEDESACCFYAGFIPFGGELDISDEEFDAGLTIHDIEYEDESTIFLMKYMSEAFERHCVVYGKYLKYGVDAKGQIVYSVQDYNKNEIDTSLGALYSYDESKYLYDDNFGNYVPITGTSLVTDIDYEALELEINKLLEEQDKNFVTVDVKTCAYFSQDAIESYLLSLQEETFLGYRVEDIRAAVANLDPLQCIRITSNGFEVIEQQYVDKSPAETAAKWLIGSVCVVTAAVSTIGSLVSIECPPLSSLSSALMGTAIDMFMQVVVEHNSLQELNWQDIVLAASTGAISGVLGPYINAMSSGAGYFFADSAIDGLLGGLEEGVKSFMNGARGKELAVSFGKGAAFAFVLSAGFKGIAGLAGNAAEKISSGVKDKFPDLAKKVSENITEPLNKSLGTLAKKVDKLPFHSKYISRKLFEKQIVQLAVDGSDDLSRKSFKALCKDNIFDQNNNPITKKELFEQFEKAGDDTIIGHIRVGDEDVILKKLNGMVGVFFDPSKYQSVTLKEYLTGDRNINYDEAAELFKESWKNNKNLMPKSIADAIDSMGTTIDDISIDSLIDIVQKSDFVFHENCDLRTVTLVARKIHDKAAGGVAHMGGVALSKFIKEHRGTIYFQRLIAAASSAISAVFN